MQRRAHSREGRRATVASQTLTRQTAEMRPDTAFAARFRLALHALGMSRGAAAAELRVDKSLVGRWAAGAVHPTDHNLSRITQLVAEHSPGFTRVDWGRELDDFAALLGLDPKVAASAVGPRPDTRLPLQSLAMAREETGRRGSAYEGLWRTSRASLLMPDKVFHDYGLIRKSDEGLLEVTMAGSGLAFAGWAFPMEGNLFAVLDPSVGFTPLFLIFRGVSLPKATMLEGIGLMAAMDASRTPAAFPLILERIGELSGDPAADEARCRELGEGRAQEDPDRLTETIRAKLFGSKAASQAALNPIFLLAASLLSRGETTSGQLEG